MSRRKILNSDAWPNADREAWESAVADGDIFDGRGPAAHWSRGTRRSTAVGYGRWLGWLFQNHASALMHAPGSRVTPDRVERYIACLKDTCGPSGIWNYVKNLLTAIRVLEPDNDWTWLESIERRLARQIPVSDKRDRTVDSTLLVDLGFNLMTSIDANAISFTIEQARAYRDGIMIALLALVPLRRRNISMIRIGSHLINVGDRWFIVFEQTETKNGQPLEFPVPDLLAVPVERYLCDVRPTFPGAADHDFLWSSMKGGSLSGDRAYNIVRKRTMDALGIRLSIHLFRDCAATTIATKAPANVMMAKDLLGHASLTTTRNHYIRAQSIEHGRHFADLVEQLKEKET